MPLSSEDQKAVERYSRVVLDAQDMPRQLSLVWFVVGVAVGTLAIAAEVVAVLAASGRLLWMP